jgi:hypothetical protein
MTKGPRKHFGELPAGDMPAAPRFPPALRLLASSGGTATPRNRWPRMSTAQMVFGCSRSTGDAYGFACRRPRIEAAIRSTASAGSRDTHRSRLYTSL